MQELALETLVGIGAFLGFTIIILALAAIITD